MIKIINGESFINKLKKLSAILLLITFVFRLFCYESVIGDYIGLPSADGNIILNAIALVLIWMEYACVIAVIINTFIRIRIVDDVIKYLCPMVFILNLAFIYPIVVLLSGEFAFNFLFVSYGLEALFGLGISLCYLIKHFNLLPWKKVLKLLGVYGLMLIASMPAYFIQFMFGYGNGIIKVNDITVAHRVMLYVSVALPIVLYFWLRKQKETVIRFTLIYISIATLVGFLVNYDYTNFLEPWSWPFHLCNTAMFLIPLCLIFKFDKLFYFTYFVNVLGALLAMLMPNYSDGTNVFSMRIFNFWYNHWIAFFMPLLIVALKLFPRPKIKQFNWAMVWFFAYYMLVLTLNVVFTAYGHEIDYFFINGDFIVDKLGLWAEKIYDINVSFTLDGKIFVFRPLYQSLFFIVYIILELAVWFIYSEFFRIADNHYELRLKLMAIKQYEFANMGALDKERKKELMKQNLEAKMELKHFSKKYSTSKVYAVKDANFEVHAGEIFGFLGPNGAGKSTIIKSTVGIQPITEGNIEICGIDVKANPVLAKYNIGYVPDHYALYEKLTGREYINYIADIYEVGQEERNERIERYIKLFELEHSIDSKMRTYSHGMKQKITIMAALVHEPKVWILDEPLTGLDPNSIYQVKECMKEHAAKGNIVFFSSHIIDIVEKLCQRIAIIKKGQIQCVKTIEEVEATGKSLEDFYLEIING